MLEIKKIKDRYRFVVSSRQGNPLLESVDFASESELRDCLGRIRSRLASPGCFERKTVHSGQFQFHLRDPGGRVVGHSALYRSEAGMENGIRNTRSGFLESDRT